MTAVVVRSARAEDQSALAVLWAEAFTPPLAPDQWLVDADRLAHTLVAEDGDGVCGSIYGLPKRLRESDGAVASVHAIGSVAVAERARGRGLARRLVSASLETGREADWALLFTGTPEVYRSSGFTSFAMSRTLVGPWSAASVVEAAAGAILRESVGLGSLGAVHDVYERSRSGQLVLAPVRSDRDWTMAEVRMRGATLYRHVEDAAVVGYAIAEARGGVGLLHESAVLPDAVDPVGVRRALLGAVAADWASAGVRSCDLATPALAEEEAAVQAFAPGAVRQHDRTGMSRPLRREPRLDGIRHFTAGDYF
ncbi:GNAT family N-acetyltransferase [Microbacterium sp. Y-01]|uniref:GNAT family N-acetyltransferase n=1 Tax=Microbacterium sp. Y-01 TaxID=2048898 RepID=UPI000F5EE811|nr:GNAT family N-acetyltransferase [Microbacterium sp. Y-01]AZH77139.1 GNAT family N-acetyltransferase [Microbacterium sp. Y-01]